MFRILSLSHIFQNCFHTLCIKLVILNEVCFPSPVYYSVPTWFHHFIKIYAPLLLVSFWNTESIWCFRDKYFSLPYIKRITNKDLLAPGTLLNVKWKPGWEGVWGRMDTCMYTWLSHPAVHLKWSQHCLLISHTPIQDRKSKKINTSPIKVNLNN